MATARATLAPYIGEEESGIYDFFLSAAEVKSVETSWLVPGRFVAGHVGILEGDPSTGKSTFLSALAAAISTGNPFLTRPKSKPAGVLWLSAEEDPGSMIRPRLLANGADLTNVHFPALGEDGAPRRITIPGSLKQLRAAIVAYGLALVIVDPLISFVSENVDLNLEASVRSALDPLTALCMSTGCTVVVIRHLKKDRSGPRMTHGFGSMAISAIARSVLVIDRPEATDARRVLRTVKTYGGHPSPAVVFSIAEKDGAGVMVDVKELGADEDDATGDMADAGERDVREDARQLLRVALKDEWMKASTIIQNAKDSGISERTLRKVKTELKIPSRRVGDPAPGYCEWGPPGTADKGGGIPPVQSRTVQSRTRKKRGKSGGMADSPPTLQHCTGGDTPPSEGGNAAHEVK